MDGGNVNFVDYNGFWVWDFAGVGMVILLLPCVTASTVFSLFKPEKAR